MEITIGIMALLIGGFGVLIMIQQKKLSDKQLKLSRFDKYFKIYNLSEDFIFKMLMGWVTSEECADYFKQMKEAEYLLDSELNDFITKIHSAGLELAGLNNNIKAYEGNMENFSEQNRLERKKFMSKKSEILKSTPSLRDELKMRFDEILKVDK